MSKLQLKRVFISMNGSIIRVHHGYLRQLLKIQGINNVKQNEIHTTAMSF